MNEQVLASFMENRSLTTQQKMSRANGTQRLVPFSDKAVFLTAAMTGAEGGAGSTMLRDSLTLVAKKIKSEPSDTPPVSIH